MSFRVWEARTQFSRFGCEWLALEVKARKMDWEQRQLETNLVNLNPNVNLWQSIFLIRLRSPHLQPVLRVVVGEKASLEEHRVLFVAPYNGEAEKVRPLLLLHLCPRWRYKLPWQRGEKGEGITLKEFFIRSNLRVAAGMECRPVDNQGRSEWSQVSLSTAEEMVSVYIFTLEFTAFD